MIAKIDHKIFNGYSVKIVTVINSLRHSSIANAFQHRNVPKYSI